MRTGRTIVLLTIATILYAASVHADATRVDQTPEQIVNKAIAYHDPGNVWHSGRVRLGVQTTYSKEFAEQFGGSDATLALNLSPARQQFSYTKKVGTDNIEVTIQGDHSRVAVNGSVVITKEDRQRLRVQEATRYRDYCEYLYGMPMKLRDPGTILDPDVRRTRFNDRDVLQLKVTYAPEVGEHTWYFYFDVGTCALVGYRFYLDESQNDGEYITLEGEIANKAGSLRLPKTRSWYYNVDDRHLATDEIVWLSTAE